LEGDAYLKLEQEGLELKQAYDKRISDIKLQNEKAIRKLVDEFKLNLIKVQEEMKESQMVSAHLQIFYAKKLQKHENAHEYEIVDNKERHKNLQEELTLKWKELEAMQKQLSTDKLLLTKERD
jgi:hypothetical protein